MLDSKVVKAISSAVHDCTVGAGYDGEITVDHWVYIETQVYLTSHTILHDEHKAAVKEHWTLHQQQMAQP